MTSSTLLLRSLTLVFGFLSLLPTSSARVLPKVKRDNATCCGFKLTNRNNIRYLYEHIIDFSALNTLDDVTKAGWGISNGWQTGGTNPATGQVAWADERNVKLFPGVGLMMVVPGGQSSTSPRFSAAEISFPWVIQGGYIEVEAMLSNMPGTAFEMFTIHGDSWALGWQDQQAFKVTSRDPLKAYLMNAHPSTGAMSRTTPFLSSPSSEGYHTFSMEWVPNLSCPALNQPGSPTIYRYDGTTLPGPATGFSANPSQFIIAHLTNGEPDFMAGPPVKDSVLIIKRVRAYFDRPNKIAAGACPMKGAVDCPVQYSCGAQLN